MLLGWWCPVTNGSIVASQNCILNLLEIDICFFYNYQMVRTGDRSFITQELELSSYSSDPENSLKDGNDYLKTVFKNSETLPLFCGPNKHPKALTSHHKCLRPEPIWIRKWHHRYAVARWHGFLMRKSCEAVTITKRIYDRRICRCSFWLNFILTLTLLL